MGLARKKSQRNVSDYLAVARQMDAFAPSLKKYRKRKTLSRWEKAAITRKQGALAGAYNLQALTKKQAKVLKDVLFTGYRTIKTGPRKGQLRREGGIQAIQLSNTGEKVKLNVIDKNLFIETNGRTWVYQRIQQFKIDDLMEENDFTEEEAREVNASEMINTGRRVFDPASFKGTSQGEKTDEALRSPEGEVRVREAFPVEKIIRLAERAFKNPTTKMIGLWATAGRVGEGFRNIKEFVRWVYEDYSRYSNVERWVNGIAVLIADVGDPVHQSMWSTKTVNDVKKARQARARVRRKQRRG